MTLRQQLIQDRVELLAETLEIPNDQAFERFVHSVITGQSVHSLAPADWVDGGQDKQIDLISLEEDEDEAELYVISVKLTTNFSSNAIILMSNGINWLLKRPKAELATLTNQTFRDKITDVRSQMHSIGWSNVSVRCFLLRTDFPVFYPMSASKK